MALERVGTRSRLFGRLLRVSAEDLEQPFGRRCQATEIEVIGDSVRLTISHAARRHNHVPAVAADVDTLRKAASLVCDRNPFRQGEQKMTSATWRFVRMRSWDASMTVRKCAPCRETVRVAGLFRHVGINREDA